MAHGTWTIFICCLLLLTEIGVHCVQNKMTQVRETFNRRTMAIDRHTQTSHTQTLHTHWMIHEHGKWWSPAPLRYYMHHICTICIIMILYRNVYASMFVGGLLLSFNVSYSICFKIGSTEFVYLILDPFDSEFLFWLGCHSQR